MPSLLSQASAALKAVWPVTLDMILGGHLEQLYTKRMSHLCLYQQQRHEVVDFIKGSGGSAEVVLLRPTEYLDLVSRI